MIEAGKPIPEVAGELGVRPGTPHSRVSRWRRNGSASSDHPAPAASGGRLRDTGRAGLERLRREMTQKNERIRELERERDVFERCMGLVGGVAAADPAQAAGVISGCEAGQNIPIAALELRHRQRARAEDHIRAARATGLRNLPLHGTAQDQFWLEITQIVPDLLVRMPMLSLTGPARLWEPKRLRLRLFSAAQLVTTG